MKINLVNQKYRSQNSAPRNRLRSSLQALTEEERHLMGDAAKARASYASYASYAAGGPQWFFVGTS